MHRDPRHISILLKAFNSLSRMAYELRDDGREIDSKELLEVVEFLNEFFHRFCKTGKLSDDARYALAYYNQEYYSHCRKCGHVVRSGMICQYCESAAIWNKYYASPENHVECGDARAYYARHMREELGH